MIAPPRPQNVCGIHESRAHRLAFSSHIIRPPRVFPRRTDSRYDGLSLPAAPHLLGALINLANAFAAAPVNNELPLDFAIYDSGYSARHRSLALEGVSGLPVSLLGAA